MDSAALNDQIPDRQSVFDRLSKPNFDDRLKIPTGLRSSMDFASVVGCQHATALKFFPLKDKVASRIDIPVELAKNVAKEYHATLYGYFLGPRLPFATVQRHVKSVWSKFGFIDIMMNNKGFYFFKFATRGGCDQVIENGPIMIQGVPLFVFPWEPTKGLTKPLHTSCPLWVKLHNIPLVAFNTEGIARIASALGVPKQMDACTASMCDRAWGRPGFAKVLIDVWAVGELKRELQVVIPHLDGGESVPVRIEVEYLWEPLQCSECLVFGHKLSTCPNVKAPRKEVVKSQMVDAEGFQLVKRKVWKPKLVDNQAEVIDKNTNTKPLDVDPVTVESSDAPIREDLSSLVADYVRKLAEESALDTSEGSIQTTIEESVKEPNVPTSMASKDAASGVDNIQDGGNTTEEVILTDKIGEREKDAITDQVPFIKPVVDALGMKPDKPSRSILKNSNRFIPLREEELKNKKVQATGGKEQRRDDVSFRVERPGKGGIKGSSPRPTWNSNVAYSDTGARIIIAWDHRSVDVMVLEMHAQFIHCLIRVKGLPDPFYATFVYGSNNTVSRRELWSGLRKAKVLMANQPWVVLGDFNAMLFPHDGHGGSSRRNADMEDFYMCIEDIELIDIQYSGIQFTWCQKPQGEDGINRKLDRILGNVEFTSTFLDATVSFLPRGISDHSPGVLQFGEGLCAKKLKKPIRQLRSGIGNVSKRVRDLKIELDVVQLSMDMDPTNKELHEDLAHLYLAYNHALMDEESFFRQRAKVKWLLEGDRNTKYFHKCVQERRARSFIHHINDKDGNLVRGDDVGTTFLNHFQDILGVADSGVSANVPSTLFSSSLLLSEALHMIRPITDDEIRTAMFAIGNDKAPGSDGFTSKFFKASWDIIGGDVMVAIHNFFYSGRLLKELNHTLLCLIPKVPNASKVGDFRPISCCSVLYKTISKLISDRMKMYLNKLVSGSQSAFIPGRRISDNILLAYELVNGYKQTSGPPRCAFKIDIRKAYDSVDWSYILCILQGFGFHPVFVGWIREMMHTSSFSLAINGGSVGFFKGARGLRQGDPISPYIFTLVMEGFNMALRHCISQASESFGYHRGCENLHISHLCFADDLFVFTRGDIASVEVLKRALQLFREWSGLGPSLEKSEVFFANVSEDVKNAILGTLPFSAGTFPIRYLGVPLSPTRLKVADYGGLITKVKQRIHNWKTKCLSFAGRRQLICSVLQSMQLYWMSVFILPSGVIHELEALFRNFLWAQGGNAQGKCRLSWDSVCRPIHCGGLGIRKLSIWNRALVSRHLWDIATKRASLWVDWIHLHYIRNGTVWNINVKPWWSWLIRKLFDIRPLVKRFIFSKLGDGLSTMAWSDWWVCNGPLSDLIPYRQFTALGVTRDSNVREVLQACGSSWPATWIERCPDLQPIDLPTVVPDTADTLCWRSLDGCMSDFTVSVAYLDMHGNALELPWTNSIWFKGNIPKHAFCMWLAFQGRLPTQDRLHWKHDPPDLKCFLCGNALDSHDHLFFSGCAFSLEIWRTIKKDVCLYGFPENWNSIVMELTRNHKHLRLEQKLALQASVYHIWRERNRRLFGHGAKPSIKIVQEIREVVLKRMAWKTFEDAHYSYG
ncbi:hypothetical protein OSB04_024619 [Centaurea solstitialis]|uniref:Reverse transcriptase domain-containing protein n=1 Tax=Centaurea solstitialis TaxID=347529 RepID=A0AA38W0U3_9ASTR|nr:hypothetical protein OSB04_024619 [Centaurea solstitialis]